MSTVGNSTADERPPTIVLVDGEHHPDVVHDALQELALDHEIRCVLFVGGEEKLAVESLADTAHSYGFELTHGGARPVEALRRLAASLDAQLVVDLSGEPVLDGPARMQLACAALEHGLTYRMADTEIVPPVLERLDTDIPLIAVTGTGKRTGKTALGGHFARLLRESGMRPVVVSMGRGGPATPQVVSEDAAPDVAGLLELARSGRHAASDYLEDAVLAGVPTVGCRRCGEGLAGSVNDSNVFEGARLGLTLDPDVMLLEGSGAAFPPVASDRTVCVTNTPLIREQALSYLGPFRLTQADLVITLGAMPSLELRSELEAWAGGPVIAAQLRPEPAQPVDPGARVALFATAREQDVKTMREQLEERGLEIIMACGSLARRRELAEDLKRARAERCDVYLTELKAAAVEIVAEQAAVHGVRLVFVRNKPGSLDGEPDLDTALLGLADMAVSA